MAAGLSGDPLERLNYQDAVAARTSILSEPQTTVETNEPPIPIVSTTTYLEDSTTSTVAPALTLSNLVDKYFEPGDREWALRTAFCESSAQPDDTTSTARHSSSGASGWFQHLPKFWEERSRKAGIEGGDIMDPENNVIVAAWLLYNTPQQEGHWYPSEHCWIER